MSVNGRGGIWQLTGEKELYEQLTFYKVNVPLALQDAITAAAQVATEAMYRKVLSSTTLWGEYRVSQGRTSAGRVETGEMVDSIWDTLYNEAGPAAVSAGLTSGGNFRIKFGWLGGPSYTTFQESGTSTIRGMFALQAGWAAANKAIFELMGKYAEEGRNAAMAKRYYKRAGAGVIKGRPGQFHGFVGARERRG